MGMIEWQTGDRRRSARVALGCGKQLQGTGNRFGSRKKEQGGTMPWQRNHRNTPDKMAQENPRMHHGPEAAADPPHTTVQRTAAAAGVIGQLQAKLAPKTAGKFAVVTSSRVTSCPIMQAEAQTGLTELINGLPGAH